MRPLSRPGMGWHWVGPGLALGWYWVGTGLAPGSALGCFALAPGLLPAPRIDGRIGGMRRAKRSPHPPSRHLLSQARNDLLGEGCDLVLFVAVGHENDTIDAGGQMRLELFHALLHRSHNGALHGR